VTLHKQVTTENEIKLVFTRKGLYVWSRLKIPTAHVKIKRCLNCRRQHEKTTNGFDLRYSTIKHHSSIHAGGTVAIPLNCNGESLPISIKNLSTIFARVPNKRKLHRYDLYPELPQRLSPLLPHIKTDQHCRKAFKLNTLILWIGRQKRKPFTGLNLRINFVFRLFSTRALGERPLLMGI